MIEKSVLLDMTQPAAFRLFTERIADWWPKTHRPSKDPESRLFLEAAGRFFERATDGREIELGRVLVWAPPERLELDFYIGTGADRPTALVITFTPEDTKTRVSVNHRPKKESEDIWAQRAPVFDRSWDAVLAAYANR